MSVVYVLYHDDRSYDMGDAYIRGIYSTEQGAGKDLVSRTSSGRVSTSWRRHNNDCCSVEEFDLDETARDAVVDEPPPVKNTGGFLIPQSFIDQLRRDGDA